ncbi:glycoside hydrolase family 97 N-terminal domain-containing protein [Larkinella rosea]|uniref:glycoside hydrolase family 97 N-terminal domain-containing protein n=1 Tax=Larkinella rosea TaxID=2025312 RepID=UPI001639DD2E|nr:glycoside hydrolase family 97 N-terminal domain-containing protein [Larkinella rosea]
MLFLLLGCCQSLVLAQLPILSWSPNRSLHFLVRNAPTGEVSYEVRYKNRPVIKPSTLGFVLSKPRASRTRFRIMAIDSARKEESWKPICR